LSGIIFQKGSENVINIGGNIRRVRKMRKLTQIQLAALIGAKHNSISDWETNKNKPDVDTIELLMGALGVDANTLFWVSSENETDKVSSKVAVKMIRDERTNAVAPSLDNMSEDNFKAIVQIIEHLGKN